MIDNPLRQIMVGIGLLELYSKVILGIPIGIYRDKIVNTWVDGYGNYELYSTYKPGCFRLGGRAAHWYIGTFTHWYIK